MGTDRSIEYSGSVPAARERLRSIIALRTMVEVATPEWYEASISCPVCSSTYRLQQFGKAFHLVYQAELAAIAASMEKVHAAADRLREMAIAKGLAKALTNLLDNQRSLAATHRLLSSAGLEHCAQPRFGSAGAEVTHG